MLARADSVDRPGQPGMTTLSPWQCREGQGRSDRDRSFDVQNIIRTFGWEQQSKKDIHKFAKDTEWI